MSPWAQPHCAVGGENRGSDHHKGLSAAPGASRSHQPCNSPSLDSWSRLPSITYFSVCSPNETINKCINKLPPGEKHILSCPLWISTLSKAGLYFFSFRLLQWVICQKTPSYSLQHDPAHINKYKMGKQSLTGDENKYPKGLSADTKS